MSRPALASAVVYAAVTVLMGRDVLANLATRIASDAGDPVLNAAILVWNARNIPWTDAWFDFPGFFPAPDVLTFSEHLLGVSVVASPLYWMGANPLAMYNLTLLLAYVLSGLAGYALVWRLTRSAAAAFLAGLAFAFAPYRISQIAHIQVAVVFWAPLALLGLHAYLETGKRRWLALFGVCWMLQGAANGYFLVFFSVVVGLWVLWFVVLQRRWRDLAMIAAAGVLASLPLAPILARFVSAHERYAFMRGADEIASFSGDIASIFCASHRSTVWEWVDAGVCGAERQLFPGPAIVAICIAGAWWARRGGSSGAGRTPVYRLARMASVALLTGAVLMAAAALSVALAGRWEWSLGPLHASASSVLKPFSRAMVLLLLAAVCSPMMWNAVRTASVPAFYALTAAVTWMLAWGPAPTLIGEAALVQGPYAWLMMVPGLSGLRVPARFWMMTVLCLSVLMGLLLAKAFRHRPGRLAQAVVIAVAAAAVIADGWASIPSADVRPAPPRPDLLRGGVVLSLPIGDHLDADVKAELDAVDGGWFSVNGYSGYEPRHYHLLRYGSANAHQVVLSPFLARGDLHVVVDDDSPRHIDLVESQQDVRAIAAGNGLRQYVIPRQGTLPPSEPSGTRLPIAGVSASCSPDKTPLIEDGDVASRWECGPQRPTQELTVDLGAVVTTGTIVPSLGVFSTDYPRQLRVETSVDGSAWQPAWDGGVLPELLEAIIRAPTAARIVLEFAPRRARYVRLRLMSHDDVWYWSIAEMEVWSGNAGPT